MGSSDMACPSSMASMWCSCACAVVAALRRRAATAGPHVFNRTGSMVASLGGVALVATGQQVRVERCGSDGEGFKRQEASMQRRSDGRNNGELGG